MKWRLFVFYLADIAEKTIFFKYFGIKSNNKARKIIKMFLFCFDVLLKVFLKVSWIKINSGCFNHYLRKLKRIRKFLIIMLKKQPIFSRKYTKYLKQDVIKNNGQF